jgi:hypothetical protein
MKYIEIEINKYIFRTYIKPPKVFLKKKKEEEEKDA